jgi:hypothetical protein
VERFAKRFQKTMGRTVRAKAKGRAAKAHIAKPPRKTLSTQAKKAGPEKKPPLEKAK